AAKINEIEMEKREKLINSLFMYSQEILLILSNTMEISFVSSNVDKIIMLDHVDMVGQPFTSFLHQEDVTKAEQAVESLSGGDELIFQLRIKNGETAYVQVESSVYNALQDEAINGYVFKMTAVGEGTALTAGTMKL